MHTAELFFVGPGEYFRSQLAVLARRHPRVFFHEQDGLNLLVSSAQREALERLRSETGWELRPSGVKN